MRLFLNRKLNPLNTTLIFKMSNYACKSLRCRVACLSVSLRCPNAVLSVEFGAFRTNSVGQKSASLPPSFQETAKSSADGLNAAHELKHIGGGNEEDHRWPEAWAASLYCTAALKTWLGVVAQCYSTVERCSYWWSCFNASGMGCPQAHPLVHNNVRRNFNNRIFINILGFTHCYNFLLLM